MARRAVPIAFAILGASACGQGTPTSSPVEPLGDDVPMPTMRVGDVLEYESRTSTLGVGSGPTRWTLTVVGVDADGRYTANVTGIESVGGRPFTQVSHFAGPWNHVPPPPYAAPEALRFPLRQGASWTSVAPNPTINVTQAMHMTVKGRQTLELSGAKVDCVRVEGTSTQTTDVTVTSPTRLWYCPSLRAVGRVEIDVPTAPATQTLVAHHLQP